MKKCALQGEEKFETKYTNTHIKVLYHISDDRWRPKIACLLTLATKVLTLVTGRKIEQLAYRHELVRLLEYL